MNLEGTKDIYILKGLRFESIAKAGDRRAVSVRNTEC